VPRDQGVLKVLDALDRKGELATHGSSSRLARWLEYMARVSDVDYRTPFFATRSGEGKLVSTAREEIVTRFDGVWKQEVGEPILDAYLPAIEQGERQNIGPMSMFTAWKNDGPDKADAVFRDKPQLPVFNERAWQEALDRLQSLVGSQSSELISPDDAIAGVGDGVEGGMDTTTNSGAPFWIHPWKPSGVDVEGHKLDREVQQAYQWYRDRVKELVPYLSRRRSANELPLWWATASQRLVQKGPEPFSPKSKRLVEAYPKEEAIIAKMITTRLMDQLREVKSPWGNRIMCAWFDLPHVDGNMQLVLERAHEANVIVNSGDISNFDASVPPWALWDVGQVIATWIRGGENLTKNLIYMMVYRTALVTPSGFYGPGPSSMKSGSGFTNLVGSLTNLAMQFYGEALGLYKLSAFAVLGDDFITAGEGVNPDSTSETFAAFGMDAHPDKQYYHPDTLQYLKRLHVRGRPGGIASVYRTLGSVMSLERLAVKPKEWNKFAYVVQALSKIQNATFNPNFANLVEFIRTGDKLLLGAGMSVEEVLTGAGNAGKKLLADDARRSWKQLGDKMDFASWTVNGVLRGESLPPSGGELFRRVYGTDSMI